ncbi:carbamate kinase [Candidatus Heimdallarchaeota archaeon B3_Heim]|nr:MAG: carbamate kinase [Candidatus Heimdallarchaeota archaeon B3_Heim]
MLKPLLVIALGGNAMIKGKQRGTIEEQIENITETAKQIMKVVPKNRVVITHGNGPQVGNIMLQMEAGSHPPFNRPVLPMDICGAMTQGQIGYLIQNILGNLLLKEGPPSRLNPQEKIKVTTFVTQVVVSKDDPAFQNPTKPVGPFYSKEQAESIRTEHPEFTIIEDAGRGYRRVVPSPDPTEIYEKDQVNTLLEAGFIVVAGGGGGIPIIKNEDGTVQGVEAVIDKDLAGERLAVDVNAEIFAILTDTDQVYLNYNTPNAEGINTITRAEVQKYLDEGAFGTSLKGSMGPKLRAALRFIKDGGKKVIITSPELVADALEGKAGTTITP